MGIRFSNTLASGLKCMHASLAGLFQCKAGQPAPHQKRMVGVHLWVSLALGASLLSPARVPAAEEPSAVDMALWEALILEEPSPRWEVESYLRFYAGYERNVLRSSFQEEEHSAFVEGQAEAFAYRAGGSGKWQLSGFTQLGCRYFNDVEAGDNELRAIFAGVVKRKFTESLQTGAYLSFVHNRQFYDVSAFEDHEQRSPLVELNQFTLRPHAEWRFASGWTARLEGNIERALYKNEIEDYLDLGLEAALLREFGDAGKASLGYRYNRRVFDDRIQKRSNGANIWGSQLRYNDHAFEAEYRLGWGAQDESFWRLQAGLIFREDNGSGYHNYERIDIAQELRQRWGGLAVTLRLAWQHYTFRDEWSFLLLGNDAREWTLIRPSIEFQYQVGAHWKAYFIYEYEDARSRHYLEGVDEYEFSGIKVGMERRF